MPKTSGQYDCPSSNYFRVLRKLINVSLAVSFTSERERERERELCLQTFPSLPRIQSSTPDSQLLLSKWKMENGKEKSSKVPHPLLAPVMVKKTSDNIMQLTVQELQCVRYVL